MCEEWPKESNNDALNIVLVTHMMWHLPAQGIESLCLATSPVAIIVVSWTSQIKAKEWKMCNGSKPEEQEEAKEE